MSNKDILANFFKGKSKFKKIKKKSINSYSKMRNNLERYNVFNTESNILRFDPKILNNNHNKYSINIKPYNFYEKKYLSNKVLTKELYKNENKINFSLKNRINVTPNSNFIHYNTENNDNNNDIIPANNDNDNHRNKTSSTYYISTERKFNKKAQMTPIKKKKIKNILSINLKNKIRSYSNIDNEANKIVDYYMSNDLSKLKNILNNQNNEANKVEKVKENIKVKYSLDKKLLKMQNIKHKLMIGDYSNFKSLNIQIRTLGNKKHRNNLLKSIANYYSNQSYKPLGGYLLDIKDKTKYILKDKMIKEFEFDEIKFKNAYSERIRKKKYLKNRVKKKINDFFSFYKSKSNINRTDFMNFYEKMNYLTDRVKSTYVQIKERTENRLKYKENIKDLFLI